MHKKIPVTQLELGMYIHAFCGSWMDHPFWRDSFLLTSYEDLQRVRECAISEVWIDVSRGKDVGPAAAARSAAEVDREVDQVLGEIVEPRDGTQRVAFEDEVRRAAMICQGARDAVVSMFSDARMGRVFDVHGAQDLVSDISASVVRNPGALISLARLKSADDYTYMHSVAVCAMMVALARQLGLDPAETRELGLAGLLHDVGKATIPLDVLNKPGKLTDAEFQIVKAHPSAGHALMLGQGSVGEIPLDVALHHHEKVDGTGYPHHLDGDRISLAAKMGAVCDVYDAVTSERPYKAGWHPSEAIRRMAEWSKGHFDQKVFHAFVKTIGIYPVGSVVRLASGRLAVVLDLGEGSLLAPRVRTFFSTKSDCRIDPEVIDLGRANCQDRIVAHERPEDWGISDADRYWVTSR